MNVDIVMGSKSDMPIMKNAEVALTEIMPSIRVKKLIVSAHRTPVYMHQYAHTTTANIIIAGAGGAAHLPIMLAGLSKVLIIGVPVSINVFKGLDSFLSIAQSKDMTHTPITVGINDAYRAGVLAARILQRCKSHRCI